MSHFTVLVIASDIKAALQPFHEFECTGTNDQYVQEIDETQEQRAEYDADTETMLIDPSGARHYLFTAEGNYDVRFCQEQKDSDFGYSHKVKKVPTGWTESKVPASERRTFAEWLQYSGKKPLRIDGTATDDHKFGYFVTDAAGGVVKVVRRTNPNRKWDWWQLGGRWHGKLKLKPGCEGARGKPSLLMTPEQAAEKPGYCSAARAGDVDWDGMLAEHAATAATLYDNVTACIAGREVQSWAQVLKRRDAGEFTIDGARDFYNAQAVVCDLKAGKIIDERDGAEELSRVLAAKDRASFVDRLSKERATTWALLHDGHWTERGSMGWFGMSDATDGTTLDYVENFWLTIRALPADAHVAVVDCHI